MLLLTQFDPSSERDWPTAALRRHSMARDSPPQLSMARDSPPQLIVRSPSNYNIVVRITIAHH